MSQQYPPYPPPGFPPPGYPAPGYPPYPMPTRTSAAAVTSLVCGLLLCIPGITALIAIICGFVGIGATKNPAVRGRGMAVAGLILGILNIAGWSAGGAEWWKITTPQRTLAHQFITDLSQGNKAAATAECTNNVTADQLDKAIDWFKQQGAIQGRPTVVGNAVNNTNGVVTGTADGVIKFSSGPTRSFHMQMADQQGTWKVDGFQFQ
ncbi:MAG: DUF4190 domain-containing protein [Tepidisphaeraceae bacterium]|jgi:hypothetical protein